MSDFPRSVLGDDRVVAESDVDTRSHDALAFANIDIVVECARRRDEVERARSKVVVVVLEKRR
jgi:hypothetical protein